MMKPFYILLSGLFLILSVSACSEQDSQSTDEETQSTEELATDNEKFSYALGLMIGDRILKPYTDIDYDQLFDAIKAQHQSENTLMEITQAAEILAEYQQKETEAENARVIAAGEAYLAAHAKEEGVTVTESGLQYSVINAAEGEKPVATDNVTVHYRGTLIDGTEFDSSYARGEPANFQLNSVIPGWVEGLQLMAEGSKFKFLIPHQLAYAERGAGANIRPYETLVFEVELIKIN